MEKSTKAVVLSSGGVDSTTCLGMAIRDFGKENVVSLSCFYGQKHSKELTCATNIAKAYKIPHHELDLSAVFKTSNCPLLQHSTEDIAEGSYDEQIKDLNGGPVSTYVPFRNGLMLSAVASFALSLFPDDVVSIYLGAHADDAAGNAYADCSVPFLDTMRIAISLGTYGKVQVETPLARWNKAKVVEEGLRLRVPYELTWSCYKGGDRPCGKCGTCIDRHKAFEANGVKDPVEEYFEFADRQQALKEGFQT